MTNKRQYCGFKRRLMENFKRHQASKNERDTNLTQTYSKLMTEWLKKVEKVRKLCSFIPSSICFIYRCFDESILSFSIILAVALNFLFVESINSFSATRRDSRHQNKVKVNSLMTGPAHAK